MKPDTPAQSALKKCFTKQFCIIQENENKIKQRDGAECLHKFRISVRKTRALLAHAKYVFPERTILKFNREFKLLAHKTCNLRDLDVYFNTLNKHRVSSQNNPDEMQYELYNYIYENKTREEQGFLEYLNSGKYKKLKEDWVRILDKPASKHSSLKYADMPIDFVLKMGIIKQSKKVFKQGSDIDLNTPYRNYHELRKTCKKLRYLLEYFSDLHPKKKIEFLIRALKKNQDILGELQDCRIQIDILKNFINAKKNENNYIESSFNSIEFLISKLDGKSLYIKSLYPDIFDELSYKMEKKPYRKLFYNYKNIIDYGY